MTDQCATFPHLYIISQEIPHSKAAGSILLLRLLEQWPADRVTVYGPSAPDGAVKLQCPYNEFSPYVARFQYTRFAPITPVLSWLTPSRLPRMQPAKNAVVLSVMQTTAYYRAAWRFSRRYKLPLALIVHDDPEEIEPVPAWSRSTIRSLNSKIFRSAAVRFSISRQMRDALQLRYNAGSEILLPNRSKNIPPRPLAGTARLVREEGLVVGYAGTLGYGYGQRLEQLLPVFAANSVTLRIYSSQIPEFVSNPCVEYAGSASPADLWPRVQTECDAVILPYALSEQSYQLLYQTHFPSKLPEYLMLGMPVIISGPPYATGVQWGLENPGSCQLVPNEMSLNDWGVIFSKLRKDPFYRCSLSRGAVSAAYGEFAPEKIEGFFVETLRRVASKGLRDLL